MRLTNTATLLFLASAAGVLSAPANPKATAASSLPHSIVARATTVVANNGKSTVAQARTTVVQAPPRATATVVARACEDEDVDNEEAACVSARDTDDEDVGEDEDEDTLDKRASATVINNPRPARTTVAQAPPSATVIARACERASNDDSSCAVASRDTDDVDDVDEDEDEDALNKRASATVINNPRPARTTVAQAPPSATVIARACERASNDDSSCAVASRDTDDEDDVDVDEDTLDKRASATVVNNPSPARTTIAQARTTVVQAPPRATATVVARACEDVDNNDEAACVVSSRDTGLTADDEDDVDVDSDSDEDTLDKRASATVVNNPSPARTTIAQARTTVVQAPPRATATVVARADEDADAEDDE